MSQGSDISQLSREWEIKMTFLPIVCDLSYVTHYLEHDVVSILRSRESVQFRLEFMALKGSIA